MLQCQNGEVVEDFYDKVQEVVDHSLKKPSLLYGEGGGGRGQVIDCEIRKRCIQELGKNMYTFFY